jgi:hypothetical protein
MQANGSAKVRSELSRMSKQELFSVCACGTLRTSLARVLYGSTTPEETERRCLQTQWSSDAVYNKDE